MKEYKRYNPMLDPKNHKKVSGEKNYQWKGDNATPSSIHTWVAKHKLKPELCEICHERPAMELANLKNHHYTRNIEDYKWSCHKCHMNMDITEEIKQNLRTMNIGRKQRLTEKGLQVRRGQMAVINEKRRIHRKGMGDSKSMGNFA